LFLSTLLHVFTGVGRWVWFDGDTLVKKIGNTTYIVNVHFNKNAKETLQQKIERMLKDELKAS